LHPILGILIDIISTQKVSLSQGNNRSQEDFDETNNYPQNTYCRPGHMDLFAEPMFFKSIDLKDTEMAINYRRFSEC